MRRKLGLVVSTPRERGDWTRALALAAAATASGCDVAVFVMADAIALPGEPAARALLDAGVDFTICGTDLERARARTQVPSVEGVREGSQDDHAALARWADRLVAFT